MTHQPMPVPPIRFAQARGARLAYQDFGEGPPTVIGIPPLAQNIELAWDRPEVRAMLEWFASWCRYIHFDKRGTGASDQRAQIAELDERVEDIRAILDDAGVERVHMFAQSEGGPQSILFAATYPNRVESLILFGSGATTVAPDMTPEQRADWRQQADIIADEWGTPRSRIADAFAPSLAVDPTFRAWHQRYERTAASSQSLREALEIALAVDARDLLPLVEVPALVMHRTYDPIVSVDWGRAAAAGMPNARFVEFEGFDHFAYAGDTGPWMKEMEQFVTGTVQSVPLQPTHSHSARVITLGRFAVEVGGVEVPISEWGSRLARQLLKRLVAARGWPVTRDQLMDMLWPDEHDIDRLKARLSVLLSNIRRVLDGGVIADRQSVRLDLGYVSTDLEDLHGAADERAVVAVYGGDFLPEDVYDDWTASVRDEARTRFASAVRKLAEEALASGRPEEGAALARRLVAADPHDDAGHGLLVRALAAGGHSRAARRAHQAWQSTMAEIDAAVPNYEDVVDS